MTARGEVPVIVVPDEVAETLSALAGVLRGSIVLVGGWAVTCRLRMARTVARPTSDVDVLLMTDSRPARAALERLAMVQVDDAHPCRLTGLPLAVDLLAADAAEQDLATPARVDRQVTDTDGLRLLVPPFGELLARTADAVTVEGASGAARTAVSLPRVGGLIAAKVANISLEMRTAEKRASDGEDVVRLLEAFGVLAILDDLALATAAEADGLLRLLNQIGASGLAAQSTVSGYLPDRERLTASVDRLTRGLATVLGHRRPPLAAAS